MALSLILDSGMCIAGVGKDPVVALPLKALVGTELDGMHVWIDSRTLCYSSFTLSFISGPVCRSCGERRRQI